MCSSGCSYWILLLIEAAPAPSPSRNGAVIRVFVEQSVMEWLTFSMTDQGFLAKLEINSIAQGQTCVVLAVVTGFCC